MSIFESRISQSIFLNLVGCSKSSVYHPFHAKPPSEGSVLGSVFGLRHLSQVHLIKSTEGLDTTPRNKWFLIVWFEEITTSSMSLGAWWSSSLLVQKRETVLVQKLRKSRWTLYQHVTVREWESRNEIEFRNPKGTRFPRSARLSESRTKDDSKNK